MINFVLKPFIFLSASGLLLSLIVHLYSFFGQQNPFGKIVWGLHMGIFIVWIPAIIVGQKLTKDFKQKDFWKAALRGCPPWLRHLTIAFFVYAIINFIIFIFLIGSKAGAGPNKELIELRGLSGHWMAFYSVALSILYSATHVVKRDKERRCRNGHPVSPLAKFCEECGAPVIERD